MSRKGLASFGFADISWVLLPAVYALLHRGAIVYVGQSRQPLARLYTHKSLWGRKRPKGMKSSARGVLYDEVWLRPCRVEELDEVEGQMILQFKPRLNVQAGRYTTVPPEMQDIVARIVAGKAAVKVVDERPQIDRRGF